MIPIGELSRRTGVHIETIRYYERTGLLAPPHRSEGGRRLYGSDDVQRLSFVRHARDLGFGLPVIRSMLALQEHPDAPCSEITRMATEQLAAVEMRIAQLMALRDELRRTVDLCSGGPVAHCRIIEALVSAPSASVSSPKQ